MTQTGDTIDRLAGVAPGSALDALRAGRDKIRALSEASHAANLAPGDPGDIPPALRAALAVRMARLLKDAVATAEYGALLARAAPAADVAALADPSHEPSDARLAAMVRRVDMLTMTPEAATRDDVAALHGAGLDDRAIVTLTGLVAFVNYQLRVAAGLRILGSTP